MSSLTYLNRQQARIAYTRFRYDPTANGGGSGGSGTVVANIAALRLITSADAVLIKQVTVQGNITAEDGLGGIYTWFAGDTSAHDDNGVVRPNDYTTGGVWKKLV